MNSDLKRSFLQFEAHVDLKHLNLSIGKRILLGISFFALLPSVFIDLVWKRRKKEDIYVLEYNNEQPYASIYKSMKTSNFFRFIKLHKISIPIIPWILVKDLTLLLIQAPLFVVKNFSFITALTIKIAQYYGLIYSNRITYLIVFQEYSFYMSYFTRVMEKRGGKLYNIMHGIPGKTYCHFRFSKCFVWSEYFKKKYIEFGADKDQFVVSGSIFHSRLINNLPKENPKIDIIYTMDGNVKGYRDVIWALEKLSTKYRVRIKQHPRQKVNLDSTLIEAQYDIIEAISKSKIIIGHYTTALLDALVMNKKVVAYLGDNQSKMEYIDYLDSKYIFSDRESLLFYLENILSDNVVRPQKKQYNINVINQSLNPLEAIEDAIYQENSV